MKKLEDYKKWLFLTFLKMNKENVTSGDIEIKNVNFTAIKINVDM